MTSYAALSKGPRWEYRVHRAAILSGWYVRRGVSLRERVGGSPQTMAEVDVLGIGFDTAIAPLTLVGECKDRKGAAKEADRVIWLLGLAQVLGADHVLFGKTNFADGTLQMARPYDLLLWDEAAVQAIEERHGIDAETGYFGSWGIALREDLLVPIRKSVNLPETRFRSATDYLANAFWYSANPARTKRLKAYFDALAATTLSSAPRRAFVADGLIALLAAAYTAAGQITRSSPAQAERWQVDAFSSGAADARSLRDIAARADDYYQDALQKVGAEIEGRAAAPITVPRIASRIAEPPGWLPSFLELARLLAQRSGLAGDALRYADVVLFEQLIAGNNPSQALEMLGVHGRSELARVLELGALFLQRVWNVEDEILDEVLASPRAGERDGNGVGASVQRPQLAFGEVTGPVGDSV